MKKYKFGITEYDIQGFIFAVIIALIIIGVIAITDAMDIWFPLL